MKYLLFSILFLFPLLMFGQGSLQFNQVVKTEWSATTAGTYQGYTFYPQSITVPAGKVWKIESMNVSLSKGSLVGSSFSSNLNGLGGSTETASIYINNTMVYSNPGSGLYQKVEPQNIWLPAGAYTFSIGAYDSSSPRTFSALVTAIEFNVVP